MRILVLTTEPLPFAGMVTTGAGLRAWGLARGLESAGLSVEIAMPDDHLSPSRSQAREPERHVGDAASRRRDESEGTGRMPVPPEDVEGSCFSRAELGAFVRRRAPDMIVMQHWGMMRELGEVDCPLAIDLAGPHLLERRFWGSRSPESDRAEKVEALQRADFVTCSGRTQRLYFLPFLDLAGFDLTDPDLCSVIPFSADPAPVAEAERDAETFVYGGMFLPWQDPSRALTTLLDAFDAAGRGRLRFFGGAHPTVDVSAGRFDRLLERLDGHRAVEMCGLVPFDQLVAEYGRASVAVDLMERNAERELAFPTRTVIYLWCGLPVIHSNYTDLAPLIAQYDAGWVLDPEDADGLREVVETVLRQPEIAREKGRNARRLVAEQLTWDKTIEPLAAWCREPRVRDGKQVVILHDEAQRRRIAELEEDLAATRSELDTLRGKWIFRLAQKRRLWGPLLAPFAFLASMCIAVVLFFALLLTRGSPPEGKAPEKTAAPDAE